MPSIEIDFEVFKKLTVLRETEDVSYNDVIRSLLKLGKEVEHVKSLPVGASAIAPADWVTKNVRFPSGTVFRSTYKGKLYTGKVESGVLVVENADYDSLSAAAVAITGSPVNGWRFWECKRPGESRWALAEALRR